MANEVVYPQGCRSVEIDMKEGQLIRRLQKLFSTLQGMEQGDDEDTYEEYNPLCHHLADEEFLQHPNKTVRLLLACSLMEILRMYAPESPYDSDQIKAIFEFLVKQLNELKNVKDDSFKKYFHVLEVLTHLRAVNMCFALEEVSSILTNIYKTMFSVVREEHSEAVKNTMASFLASILSDCDAVPRSILLIILKSVLEPKSFSTVAAYDLAKKLFTIASESLEPHFRNLFDRVLLGASEETDLDSFATEKVFDLIYELHCICPSVMSRILPQLEFRLKSSDKEERLGAVSILGKILSDKDSFVAVEHPQLWKAYLGRFIDVSAEVRLKCVEYSMHFLLGHPDLRKDIVEVLKARQHDTNEIVRLEVVQNIIMAAKYDIVLVGQNEDLITFLKERTLDRKFKIRKAALQGLAEIYKKYLIGIEIPEGVVNIVPWLKNKIFHAYYFDIEDKLVVERLLSTSLVPIQLETKNKMTILLSLYANIDVNAEKAFIEIQKNKRIVRRYLSDLLNCILNKDESELFERDLKNKITQLSKYLPYTNNLCQFLGKFCKEIISSSSIRKALKLILDTDTSCEKGAEYINGLLQQFGTPVETNLYYCTIRQLLERASSVMVDKAGIWELVQLLRDVAIGNVDILKAIGCSQQQGVSKGVDLIRILTCIYPELFDDANSLKLLVRMLNVVNVDCQPSLLMALTDFGKMKPIEKLGSSLSIDLLRKCKNILKSGTPKHGKRVVHCLYRNLGEESRVSEFNELIESLRNSLNSNCRTAIAALGHIALLMPEDFKSTMEDIMRHKIIKDLSTPCRRVEDIANFERKEKNGWCEENDLPDVTRCMMTGMKSTTLWIIGLKSDYYAKKMFKMLSAFVETGGEFSSSPTVPLQDAEKSWLRLTAGKCMLKISREKGVGDQFTADQFFTLSRLMNDEVVEVRSRFAMKLHKSLSQGIPDKCLPLPFMGFYSLAGYESDKKLKNTVKSYMIGDVTRRRNHIKMLVEFAAEKTQEQLPHIMPDYMLVYSIAVLCHNPRFTLHNDMDQLMAVRDCIWFVLEPLITKNPNYSFYFYHTLSESLSNCRDALEPENQETNYRIYAASDIAINLVTEKAKTLKIDRSEPQARIPTMFFKLKGDLPRVDRSSYVYPNLLQAISKRANVSVSGIPKEKKEKRDITVYIAGETTEDESSSEDLKTQSSGKQSQRTPNSAKRYRRTPNSAEQRQRTPNSSKQMQMTEISSKQGENAPNSAKQRKKPPNSRKQNQETPRFALRGEKKRISVQQSPKKRISVQQSPKKRISVQQSPKKRNSVQQSPKKPRSSKKNEIKPRSGLRSGLRSQIFSSGKQNSSESQENTNPEFSAALCKPSTSKNCFTNYELHGPSKRF